MPVEIMVPVDKVPLPHHKSAFVGVARTFAILGFLGLVLLFTMVWAEGKIDLAFLLPLMELVFLGLMGMLLTWRWVRPGGLAIAGAMIFALLLAPPELHEWRPWFFGVLGYTALMGILLLFSRSGS